MNYETSVVILRSPHHAGLGISRSLGRLGVPVYNVDATRWEPAFTSRYCRGRFILDTAKLPAEESIAYLLEIGKKLGGRPILIPTTDPCAQWVAEHAALLQGGFRFPQLDVSLVRTLCDKGRMQELARANGVPTALAIVPQSKEEAQQFVETAVFPVMVKAIDADLLRRRTGGTKFLIHSAQDLLALYAKAQGPEDPNLLIQEYIPGEDWMFNGYFDNHSECLFGLTGKKIRRFPASTGVTSLGICLHNEQVKTTTIQFMKAIEYRGILDIGYRYDYRDGKYKVLDINPRVGCSFRLFTGADGIDVIRALYLDSTGQPVPRSAAVEGRKWIVEDFDLFSALRTRRSGGLKLKDWIESLRGVQETACFAWDDPLPFFMMGAADCFELYHWLRCQMNARKPAVAEKTDTSDSAIDCVTTSS